MSLPTCLQRLATRWLANLPGWDLHPLDYTTLPGRTINLSPFPLVLFLLTQDELTLLIFKYNLPKNGRYSPLSSNSKVCSGGMPIERSQKVLPDQCAKNKVFTSVPRENRQDSP